MRENISRGSARINDLMWEWNDVVAFLVSRFCFQMQGLDSRQLINASDEPSFRRLVDDRAISSHGAQNMLRLFSLAMGMEDLPKVRDVAPKATLRLSSVKHKLALVERPVLVRSRSGSE